MNVHTTVRIRDLNDAFRRTFCGGRVLVTPGVAGLPDEERALLFRDVQTFTAFDGGGDPHQEHDFGAITRGDTSYFWKIDYYDAACVYGSEDPSDPKQTTRVLTIMRADEY